MRCAILSLGLLLFSGISLSASDPPSESHRKAATELLELTNVDAMVTAATSAMADAMIQQNPMLGRYRDIILDWAGRHMGWEALGPRYVTVYADAFTESELRDLIAFYRTPTGRKALDVMPELLQRGMALGVEVAREHMPELDQLIRQRAADLEGTTTEP